MTDKSRTTRDAEPLGQDVDDLIFLGQTDPKISQR